MLYHNKTAKEKFVKKRTKSFCHQTIRFTRENRYPNIFNICSKISPLNSKIMSFGCSTGEECKSLRLYFPYSKIIGIDNDIENIKIAKKRISDKNIIFDYSIENYDNFDLIFCMSVFCKHPETYNLMNCYDIYRFSFFEIDLYKLISKLNKFGHIIIYNSNFRFCDTIFSPYFNVVESNEEHGSGFVHKFDRNHNRIYEKYNECIFKKCIFL